VQRRGGTQPRPDARLSLFCFHQAGGSSSLFDALQGEGGLPGDVEVRRRPGPLCTACTHGAARARPPAGALPPRPQVLPVELPGRNARLREPRLTSMGDVVAATLAALAPALERRPFALLGHSMGAWVAYAVAQELQRVGGPLPAALYVSANRSARLAGAQHDVDATRLHALPAAQFWEAMERRYGRNPLLVSFTRCCGRPPLPRLSAALLLARLSAALLLARARAADRRPALPACPMCAGGPGSAEVCAAHSEGRLPNSGNFPAGRPRPPPALPCGGHRRTAGHQVRRMAAPAPPPPPLLGLRAARQGARAARGLDPVVCAAPPAGGAATGRC
jgi:surfactin synthase thioesterase subunit